MILVATTTLGIPARSIYSQFFTSSASQVGLAIVMREIYRYIYLFLFPTKRSYRHPRLKFHSKFLARSLESIAISNSYPSSPLPWQTTLQLDVALTVSSSHRRLTRERGGEKGKRFVRSNVLFGSSARCNNAERKTKNSRSPLHGGHLDPRTREEAVIALKWTWVAQGPPLSPWTRNNKFSTARR